MTDDISVDDVTAAMGLADEAKTKLKTDPDAVRKMASGNVQITDTVTVYPNKKINREFASLRENVQRQAAKATRADGESDESYAARLEKIKADSANLESDYEALKNKLEDSSVTFEMKSVSKKAIKNLRTTSRKKFPLPHSVEEIDQSVEEMRQDYYEALVVAAHLVSDGYTVDDVEDFQANWPNKAWADLWTTAQRLSIADDYLSATTDPDFL